MKIRFKPVGQYPEDVLDRNRKYSRSLGLPEIGDSRAAAPSLAVVGGSPDVEDYKNLIREFGEIWAINQTVEWCRNNNIDSTYYRIDPQGDVPHLDSVTTAILADCVHPDVFDELMGRNVPIELVRLGADAILHTTTAAGTAPMFAHLRGHRRVTLFGCGSSYTEKTHAYRDEVASKIWVDCGGVEYVTSPQMIMQAEEIAEMARTFPQYLTVEGTGFLPALIEHGDYSVTHACQDIHDAVRAAQSKENA